MFDAEERRLGTLCLGAVCVICILLCFWYIRNDELWESSVKDFAKSQTQGIVADKKLVNTETDDKQYVLVVEVAVEMSNKNRTYFFEVETDEATFADIALNDVYTYDTENILRETHMRGKFD